MNLHNPQCFANHMGIYACEPRWLLAMMTGVKEGTVQARPMAMEDDDAAPRKEKWGMVVRALPVHDDSGKILYAVADDGVAIVRVHGAIMKGWSKYAETDSIHVRRAIRAAVSDDRVSSIMLHIDSPGGSVSGTSELADEIQRAAKSKPVAAHIDDLGASAAYWVASAAGRITANAIGEVGSIGTYCVLFDQSKAMEMEGVKVHVISTGPLKGAGYPGTEVTPELLEYEKGLVDNANRFFLAAVRKNRGMSEAKLGAVADGRVFPAAEAKAAGLVDDVMPFEQALALLAKEGKASAKAASKKDRMALEIGLAEAEG